MEGDRYPEQYDARFEISIHALRVEGDLGCRPVTKEGNYFYPRPPGGGRRNLHFHFRFRTLHFYPRPPGGGRPP